MERRRIGEKEVTLITLPSFASSGIAVMVNLRTLEALPVEFDTMDMEKGEMEVEEKKEEEEVIIDEDMANEENEWIVFFQTAQYDLEYRDMSEFALRSSSLNR